MEVGKALAGGLSYEAPIICCTEESDDAGLSLTGFLILLVLAILLMSICIPQPRRPVYAVYRYR
ncbi:hypothetical protein Golob_016124 [Gossypium lobatum]|uniref:Uncharacterized protein n=1 Tax=Gossypium lobatum TaxID=34289 RepID=A0A7J8M351_9ROSI|nr:hypothetical protein [Gossypium lobatum]